MKINYAPNDSQQKPSGAVSVLHWENADLQAAIRRAFNESPRETIVQIDIDRYGIKAYFDKKNC